MAPDEPENLEVPAELDQGRVDDDEAAQEAADVLAAEQAGNDMKKGTQA